MLLVKRYAHNGHVREYVLKACSLLGCMDGKQQDASQGSTRIWIVKKFHPDSSSLGELNNGMVCGRWMFQVQPGVRDGTVCAA